MVICADLSWYILLHHLIYCSGSMRFTAMGYLKLLGFIVEADVSKDLHMNRLKFQLG